METDIKHAHWSIKKLGAELIAIKSLCTSEIKFLTNKSVINY